MPVARWSRIGPGLNPGWLDSKAMGSPRFPIPSFNLTLPWRLNPEVSEFLELFSPVFREGGSAALILPHRKVQGASLCLLPQPLPLSLPLLLHSLAPDES